MRDNSTDNVTRARVSIGLPANRFGNGPTDPMTALPIVCKCIHCGKLFESRSHDLGDLEHICKGDCGCSPIAGRREMGWQPIETAPKDGTEILLANGTLFAAGHWEFSIGPATIGDYVRWRAEYVEGEPPPIMHTTVNPKAGHRDEWWHMNGCTSFYPGTDVTDDDRAPCWFKPTHWMPLPKPPSSS